MNKQTRNDSLEKALIEKENALWETLRNKHPERFDEFAKRFGKFFADEYRGVYADEINARDEEIEGPRFCRLETFSFTEMETTFLTDETAVLVYKIVTKNFLKERDISGVFNASSVWVKRDGEWKLILHTEARTG